MICTHTHTHKHTHTHTKDCGAGPLSSSLSFARGRSLKQCDKPNCLPPLCATPSHALPSPGPSEGANDSDSNSPKEEGDGGVVAAIVVVMLILLCCCGVVFGLLLVRSRKPTQDSNNSGLANFPAANPVHVAGTFCSGCGLPRQGQVSFCNRCGIQFPGGGGGRPPPAPVSPSTSNLPGRPRLFYHGTSIEAGANAPS